MNALKLALAVILFAAAVTAALLLTRSRVQSPDVMAQQPADTLTAASTSIPSQTISLVEPLPIPVTVPSSQAVAMTSPVDKPVPATNKLDRLAHIRETFRTLAAGDKTNALRAAKQIGDETERETALLTLVTEWTQGELSSPRLRAERIASLGLEAGLGIELAKHAELALLWADELTEGSSRTAVLQQAARFLVDSDPAAAFELTQRLPDADRRRFSDALFANWAEKDTAAAMQWAEQFPDATERETAIQAIRSVAPVGIGTALAVQDGYPIIKDLIQGTPAQLSGQLHVGDRIVALAQGSGTFVDVYGAPLEDIVRAVRGAPNTLLQLKVVPAGAPPNTPPRTIFIMRDQIKFKK